MRRGELWAYTPKGIPRQRRMLLVSSDGINESPRPWLLAVELVDDDPGDILAVPVPDLGWVDAGSISRAYRGWLSERLDQLSAETMDSIDSVLRAALDL